METKEICKYIKTDIKAEEKANGHILEHKDTLVYLMAKYVRLQVEILHTDYVNNTCKSKEGRRDFLRRHLASKWARQEGVLTPLAFDRFIGRR